MIEFVARFKDPFAVLFFLVLSVLFSCWLYICMKNKRAFSLAPVIAVNFLLLLAWVFFFRLDHDGSGHLHLSWLVSQGLIPYKDFWQHHSPFLWVVLAPFFRLLPHNAVVFDLSRILSGSVFILNVFLAWQIAKVVWQKSAALSSYLLIVSSTAIIAEFLLLKPDIFMVAFLLAGVYTSFQIPEKRLFPCFCAGVAFSLAASFLVKQYLLFLLPVIAVFFGDKKYWVSKLAIYVLGLVTGVLPLLAYLSSRNILQDFIYWVLSFNKSIIIFSVYMPLVIVVMGWWGCYLLFERFRRIPGTKSMIMLAAFLLTTLSSLTTTSNVNGGHYLGFWCLVSSIIISGCNIPDILGKISSLAARAVVGGVLFSALVTPNMMWVCNTEKTSFFRDKLAVEELMRYCINDTCVVFLPIHPVFAFDATRVYSTWSFDYADIFICMGNDIGAKGVVSEIIHKRPAVIIRNFLEKDFILELFQKRLISAVDYKRLISFVQENYIQKLIGKERYYIRRDKL